MPRPRHAQGRPGTRVFPEGWNTTHAPVAEKTMPDACSIRVAGTTQQWSDTLKRNVATLRTPYAIEVPCRAQALTSRSRDVETGEEQVTVAGYLVTLPLGHAAADQAQVGHILTLTTGDPTLTGRDLHVHEVVHASYRFERDLFCSLVAPSPAPPATT